MALHVHSHSGCVRLSRASLTESRPRSHGRRPHRSRCGARPQASSSSARCTCLGRRSLSHRTRSRPGTLQSRAGAPSALREHASPDGARSNHAPGYRDQVLGALGCLRGGGVGAVLCQCGPPLLRLLSDGALGALLARRATSAPPP